MIKCIAFIVISPLIILGADIVFRHNFIDVDVTWMILLVPFVAMVFLRSASKRRKVMLCLLAIAYCGLCLIVRAQVAAPFQTPPKPLVMEAGSYLE